MKIESGVTLRATREAMGLSQVKLAELTGVSQHVISAYELEKSDLDSGILSVISKTLKDNQIVEEVISRKKRYQQHIYERVKHDPTRSSRCTKTTGNEEYVCLLNELNRNRRSMKHTALSLFSGCGGLSLGFSWAGFDIKGFVEIDKGLRSIYKSNFPQSREIGGNIAEISNEEIAKFRNLIGPVDVIVGGPPCQGFSLSGKRNVDDPRNTLFRDYLRFVEDFQPKIAILENVRLLTSMKSPNGGYVRDEIQKEFALRGYRVSLFEVNAKNYGVPQHRERVFFIAVRSDIPTAISFPPPTHEDSSSNLFKSLNKVRSFGDACSDLPYLESGEKSADPLHVAVSHPQHNIKWLWDVKEGCSAHDNNDHALRPPSGYNTTYKRQIWGEPGATVQTTFGMISGCRNVHPVATRSLTVREAARLQSFPDQFSFGSALGTARTGIGNAVPPLLAFSIASHISCNIL